MKTAPKWIGIAVLALALGLSTHVIAQGINANAQISGLPAGGNVFQYTITLNNADDSLSPIQTFWFGWVPGGNFLPSSPTSVQAPADWTYSISGGGYYYYGYYYPDGYSIEFTTDTAPLNPGSSLQFGFMSSDTPAAIAGDSPFYPGTPVGTSYVFSGIESGDSQQFAVQVVPEPGSPRLLAFGLFASLIVRKFFPSGKPKFTHARFAYASGPYPVLGLPRDGETGLENPANPQPGKAALRRGAGILACGFQRLSSRIGGY